MNAYNLSDDFITEIDCFLDCAKANQLSRYLRFMLLDYLNRHNHGFPTFHDDLLHDLEVLFYFLDEAGNEQHKREQANETTPIMPTLVESTA